MIYNRFKDKISIDENQIKEKILRNPKKIEELHLSEIIIEFKNKSEVQNIYNQIIKSIDLHDEAADFPTNESLGK